MSLINDMLRELEARKRVEAGTPDPLAGVAPPPQAPHGRRTVATVLGLLVALGLAAAGAGWYLLHGSPTPGAADTGARSAQVRGAAQRPQGGEQAPGTASAPRAGTPDRGRAGAAAPAPSPAPAPRTWGAGRGGGPDPAKAGTARSRLTGLEVLPGEAPDRLRLVLRLAGEVPRVTARRTARGVRVTLAGTRPTEAFNPPATDMLRSVSVSASDEGLALEALTRRPVAHVGIGLEPGTAGGGHRLEIRLRLAAASPDRAPAAGAPSTAAARRETPPARAAASRGDGPAGAAVPAGQPESGTRAPASGAGGMPADRPRMERRVRPPTPAQRAEAAYAQGLAALRVGDLAGARRAFQEAMAAVPGHPKSAEALARLELRAGRREAAEAVLRKALARHPGHSALVRLLARLQAQRGALEAAIATLRQALPGGDAALYGLLGALEQRAGRPAQAAQAYRAALAREPREGKWWVGLGIALEHLGRRAEARAAYRRARALALDPPLARFVHERLEVLK